MKRLTLALFLLLATGCGSLQDLYVDADRKTYDAVWDEYEAYYQADPNLDRDQKKRRDRTGASWRARLAEGGDQ